MPNVYAPYSTLNASGVNLEETYPPASNTPYVAPPPFALGQVVKGTDDSEWVFVQASEAIALGNVAQIAAPTMIATRITNANSAFGNLVGVASAVAVAINEYFWAQTAGYCPAITASAAGAANAQLRTTATAGAIDDTATAGTSKQLIGIAFTTAPSGAGNFPGILNNPTVGATDP